MSGFDCSASCTAILAVSLAASAACGGSGEAPTSGDGGHVLGEAHGPLQRQRVAADERVLDLVLLEQRYDSEEVVVRRCARSIIHRS